jgi:inositol transport system ATP-binding protein
MQGEVILELKGISKSFPGIKALSNIDFALRKGSVHAIVGENGAGKSTLMKILSGMYTPDEGEILLKDKKVRIDNQKQALEFGISMIYQELNSILDMNVMENIFLGREIKRKSGLTDKAAMYKETVKTLESLDIKANPKAMMRSLSIATRQMIEIAKAISREAQIIVMDEPTSSISQKEVHELFNFIKSLQNKGISIIYISHRLEEIPVIADEITILRDGHKVHNCPVRDITKEQIIKYMVGRELTNLFPKKDAQIGEPVLKASNLSCGKVFKNISFELKKGEILGFAGLVGAGRTEVMRALYGLSKFDSGIVWFDGNTISIKYPTDAIKLGIVMIPEDRRREGLVLLRSVYENVALAHLKEFIGGLYLLNKRKESNEVNKQIERLRIKTRSVKTEVGTLSGGNQQKVVVAKWLVKKPKVLIMDEPTRGIDVGAKYEIYKLMCDLASEGMAIIMISSELPEILGMSDRVIVMAEGEIKGELTRSEATQEKIMKLSAGG